MELIFTLILLFTISLALIVLIIIVSGIRKLMGKLFWKSFKQGLWVLIVPPIFFLYGALIERNQSQVNEVEITSEDIPQTFDGYRLVQISDVHLRSFIGREKTLEKMVLRINAQQPDAILVTGDLVTQNSSELESTENILAKLNAPDGVFSILGNHDYSFYSRWESEEQRHTDVAALIERQRAMGWHLLMNENRNIARGADTISIIGVENISTMGKFKSFGDLKKAMHGAVGSYKILMSHDPSHWRSEVTGRTDIGLTLSGHTHAMQSTLLGWSISSFVYDEYKGLYTEGDQHLYVNIGLGETMFPIRIGAKPEITVITLRSN